ncbi:OmpA family protein [Thermomonospora cellulosilytica]|uniref:Type VI secretion system protein ImpK n=1 Tax=Thermomonospora cellulosilytica TaxID=1411118 RepID=A0A7W3MTG7_9ACTN|nr:OmpA family protein [Thermomonospora cellulosilytica]MBA9001583.1 type VI secretion system protein ImpK [Thermomonospora cellulosilytica]
MTAPAAAPDAVREITLAQARTLARRGRYLEAERLLDELAGDGGGPDVTVLDLLARVYAQQGRLEEADRCWAEAERLAPDAPEITEGRRRIAALRGSRPRRATTGLLGRVVAVLVAVLILALLLDIRGEVRREPTAASPPPAPRPAAPADALPDLAVRLGDMRGVGVERLPGELVVTFPEGLFRSGATLTADGRAVLEDVGGRLRAYAGRITVTVVGHTDSRAMPPGGEFASNAELGLARATVVRELLRRAAGLPTAALPVSTMGGVAPPFPDAADQSRNRTVSLRISAARGG